MAARKKDQREERIEVQTAKNTRDELLLRQSEGIAAAEARIRDELQAERDARAAEAEALRKALREQGEECERAARAERLKNQNDFVELRDRCVTLHKQNTDQQFEINTLRAENSSLRMQLSMNSQPGGRRQTDTHPPGAALSGIPTIPPGSTFSLKVESSPPPHESATPQHQTP